MKGIAKDGVEQMGDSSSQKLSLVYGEIDFFSFANILERSSPKRGDVFVDLGVPAHTELDKSYHLIQATGLGRG